MTNDMIAVASIREEELHPTKCNKKDDPLAGDAGERGMGWIAPLPIPRGVNGAEMFFHKSIM